jgi:competence protein ComEC
MTEAFRAAGLGHLLAVSGQNVAILLAGLTPALRRLSRWPRLAAALCIIATFALVTRLESSVVRAGVMAGIVQVAYAIGRDVAPLRALCLTAMVMVVLDPLAVWSIGFVLSVAATAGLVVIAPLLGSGIVAATASAQVAVAPFVVFWFRSMPAVALATNVLAVPVASGVMMVAPPLLLAAAFLPDPLAAWCVAPVVVAVRLLWWVAEWGLRLALPAWANAAAWLLVAATLAAVVVRRAQHPRARL